MTNTELQKINRLLGHKDSRRYRILQIVQGGKVLQFLWIS